MRKTTRPSRPPDEEKPLFIPLFGWAFNLYASGVKTTEYRLYGPRWNERTCAPGRRVTLSYGYGKARRLTGVISSLEVSDAAGDAEAWGRAFGSPLKPGQRVAAIGIKLDSGQ